MPMTMVIYAIRTTHQNSSMITIGTKALPAPRQIDAIAWEYASRQKNSAVVRIWRVPSSTTSGVGLNSATSCGARWNGKGIFIKLQVPDEHSKMTSPYIYIDTTGLRSNNPDAPRSCVPWLASQTDMLAEDWEIAEVQHG